MAVYICRRCGYESSKPWLEECPGCLGFYRWKKEGPDAGDARGLVTMGGGRGRAKHQYLSTGQAGFDKVLGGGLVASRVVLLGGFAGTGKTRSLLAICDFIAKTQGVAVYASGEESTEQLNDICKQLGLRNNRVHLLGSQASVETVIKHAEKHKAFLVVFDSAQKFTSETSAGTSGSGAQCKAIGEVIKTYCGRTKTCAIIVNQMAGSGELKSGTELEHHCDTIMVLAYPKDDDEDVPEGKDVRVLAGSKNRVGPENQKAFFRMTEEGRLEHIAARSRLLEEPRRKYGKRVVGGDEDAN